MTGPDDDRDIPRLLHDAVSDVEPADRLAEIRLAVAHAPRRFGWYAAGGGAIAVAAAVTAVSLITNQTAPKVDDPDPLATPSGAATSPSTTAPPASTSAAAVYYVGDTPSGPRLYREFRPVPKDDPMNGPLLLVAAKPTDPDYRTLWPAGSLVDAGFDGIGDDGFISVTLADPSLSERPQGLTADEARLAVQAVVYTIQGALKTRAYVEFYAPEGRILDTVLGVPAERDPDHSGVRAYSNSPPLDVLSLMSISNPTEGRVVTSGFTADGAANGFEGTVACRLLDADGDAVWEEATIAGWQEPKLFPWELTVDLAGVAPGTYQFWCSTDDPIGGTEGRGADVDTRTVVVE